LNFGFSREARLAIAPVSGVKQQTLGTLWFLYGLMRITMAVFLVVFNATTRLMFGALLLRVPHPLAWMTAFEVIYWIIIAWCVVCAILSVMAAGALFVKSRSAGLVARIAALVCLPEAPFGLVLGVYTLLVFPPRPAMQT
jgi:hypothetical protein